MAKTTPSRRAKSKTPAPKKKPTQLDRIERSIGLIESKLTTLNAWETLNEAMSNDKLASPTVAVEEKWVPKVGDYFVPVRKNEGWPGWTDKMESLIGTVRKVEGFQPESRSCIAAVGCVLWDWAVSCIRPATPEEIAAHEAKVKAEAQAAEDAKLVFGARVKVEHSEAEWLYLRAMQNDPTAHLLAHDDGTAVVFRQFFTLLP